MGGQDDAGSYDNKGKEDGREKYYSNGEHSFQGSGTSKDYDEEDENIISGTSEEEC